MIQPLISTEILLEEKRSRFIAELIPASNEAEIKARIQQLKKQHNKASHVCSAFRLGDHTNLAEGFSDDGEPSGTAGMPMLKTLRHKNITNCAILITRYFGGTKLGTGGLQRAYSQATSQAILALGEQDVAAIIQKETLIIQAKFQQENQIRHMINSSGVITATEYLADGVRLQIEVECNLASHIKRSLADINISFSEQ